MGTRSAHLGIQDQLIQQAFQRAKAARIQLRQDDGRGDRPELKRLHAFRYYLRKKITPERYLQHVLDGIVTAIDRNAGTCTVVAEGWDELLENVHYYPPNKPPRVDDHHAVHFEVKLPTRTINETTELEVADRWVKVISNFYLYYAHTHPEKKIWRIEWPPNEIGHIDGPSVPEIVVDATTEWGSHDPPLRIVNLLGVNQQGHIYIITNDDMSNELYLEIWEPASNSVPTGQLIVRYTPPSVPTEGSLGQIGTVQIFPVGMDSEGDPSYIVGYVRVNDATLGVGQEQTIKLYESLDNGATWTEKNSYPEGSSEAPPSINGTLYYSGRIGYEYAGAFIIDSSESGALGTTDQKVGLVSWPFYDGVTGPALTLSGSPRTLALLRPNSTALELFPPQNFGNAVEAIAPNGNNVRAIVSATTAPPGGGQVCTLYRTDNLGSGWQSISLPSQTLWPANARIILAQDRFADKLIIAEYDAESFRVGTWFSEDSGITWKEIDTTNTFHFVRGVVVEQ